ncbi:MAG: imidazole glycerol phosphate synthase subunit HisH [Planctomycetota bacterium]|nr:MAG: imidazole glycerol phosphate synthase subunit HisH [Planctomycetota bacterium]
MSIAIIDYRAGNLTSVQRAISALGHQSVISSDFATITQASRVIFPGVGAAATCMQALRESGCDEALRAVVAAGTPLLGICVGMQLLLEFSEEDGGVPCLGLIPGRVRRFAPSDPLLKVPHMGWNPIAHNDGPLFTKVPPGSAMYFVHSYYCDPEAEVTVTCTSEHGTRFCAGLAHGSIQAVQFHPEKSGPVGLQLLANFLGPASTPA